MRIIRVQFDGGFAVIPNETARDERLSFAARGMLGYLLSRGDDWKTNADQEWQRAKRSRNKHGEGREAMRRIWRELKDADYMHDTEKVHDAAGRVSTRIYLFNRPVSKEEFELLTGKSASRADESAPDSDDDAYYHSWDDVPDAPADPAPAFTDIRETGSPESRTSVPPAETHEPVDNWPEYSAAYADDVFPARTGVRETGQSANRYVGEPTPGKPYVSKKTDHRRQDEESSGVGDPIADRQQPDDRPPAQPEEHPIANSQDRRVHDGPEAMADVDRECSLNDSGSAPPGCSAGAREGDGLGDAGDVSERAEANGTGGAGAPLSEPAQTAASDATRITATGYRWKSQAAIAAEQAAASRALREAAERAAAVTP